MSEWSELPFDGDDEEQPERIAHNPSERAEIVARVRRLARIAGIPTALPEEDATVYGAIFTCLGMIAGALERTQAATQARAAASEPLSVSEREVKR